MTSLLTRFVRTVIDITIGVDAPEMRPASAPVLSLPSVRTDTRPFEPDEQWRADLRKRIEHDLRHLVEDARTARDTILNSHSSERSHEHAQREYEEKMDVIRRLAQEDFNREMAIEMCERKWALDLVDSNSPSVARRQQSILDNICKPDDNRTSFVKHNAPRNAGGVLSASRQERGDSKRASDEGLEGGYGSIRPENKGSGSDKSVESEEKEEWEWEEEEGVQPRQSRPPSRSNVSLIRTLHTKSPVSRRDTQSRHRRPSNLRSEEDRDDEGEGDSPAHPAQPREPFPSGTPPRHQSPGSHTPVWGRVARPSEPSGISRTFALARGQMHTPNPVQFPRGRVDSTASNSSGTSLHRAGSLNSDQHRSRSVTPHNPHNGTERPSTQARDRIASNIGHRDRQVSISAGIHDRPSPSIYPTVAPRAIPSARPPPLDDAVRFPTSVSPASRTLLSTQRSPEDTRQGIAIPRRPTTSEEGPRGASCSSLHSFRSYGDFDVRQRHNSGGIPRLPLVDGDLSDDVSQLDDRQSVHNVRNMELEQTTAHWDAEARHKEEEGARQEEEATKEVEARLYEEKARQILAEAQRLEAHAHLEASVKIREAAVQKKEAEVNLRELEAKKREAGLHRREEEVQLKEAEALRKEEEVILREGNARRNEEETFRFAEMSQQSLRNAQRLESSAREAETSAKIREAAAQKREAEANLRELETKKREADLHGREEGFRLKVADAVRKEEEVIRREGNARTKEEEARRLEEMSQRSLRNSQRLESGAREAESSAKMREAAAQKREADAMREEAKVKKREAEVQMREVQIQTREAEVLAREAEALVRETEARRMEEANHRDGEVGRLEEKLRQSLEEAERLEASAHQAEVSAKMYEAAAQQKEADAVRRESEARRLEAEVQYKVAETCRREEEASKKEEEMRLLEERARRFLEEAERFDSSIRRAEASSKMRETQPCHVLVPETSHHHDRQPYLSRNQAEPPTNGAKAETRAIEEQLLEKERYLQLREAEIQRMLQTADERKEAMDLKEDSLRQRLAAMREQEETLRRLEAALTQSIAIESQRNGIDREADLHSLVSTTIANSPRIRANVGFSFSSKSIEELKDSENYSNEG